MNQASLSLQLWNTLKDLEEYIRNGIVSQMSGATSFGGEDMVPLKDAHLTCERLKPVLPPPLYEGAHRAVQIATNGLNGMLDEMRQALTAPPPLRAERLQSACDRARAETLEQYRRSLVAVEPLIGKDIMSSPTINVTGPVGQLNMAMRDVTAVQNRPNGRWRR